MKLSRRSPVSAYFRRRQILCVVCGSGWFYHREVLLSTSGMQFLNMGWANESALGLTWTECGNVLQFVGDQLELFKSEA